jgi:putative DNA primase/helicase
MADENDLDQEKVVDLKKRVEERRAKEAEEYGSSGSDSGSGGLSSAFVRKCLNANELGDGILYAHLNQKAFLFCQNFNHWIVWNGNHWEMDIMKRSHFAVEKVCEVYLNEIEREYDRAKQKNEAPDGSLIKSIYSRVKKLRTKSGRNNCMEFSTQCEFPLAIRGDELDAKPLLLPTKNGVLDLETGVLRPGRQEDLLLKATPVEWTGIDAPCPEWEKALMEIFSGNEDLVEYIQRLFGYAITGLNVEHIFPVFHGQGRNGKTMIMETLCKVMGELAAPIQSDLLLDQGRARGSSGPSPDLMGLKGLHIAVASETDQGRKISPSRTKWITGGDEIVARSPHDKYETKFTPTHTLFLLTNNKPHAPAEDFAFWERVHLVPFLVSFVDRNPEAENERRRDRDLTAKLTEELSGILAWLVRGCLQWQKEGLNPPPIVKEATSEYRRDEDLMADFVDECCVIGPDYSVNATDFYKQFAEWWKEAIGRKPPAQKTFGRLVGKKFEKHKSNGLYRYYGVGLVELVYD